MKVKIKLLIEKYSNTMETTQDYINNHEHVSDLVLSAYRGEIDAYAKVLKDLIDLLED